MRFGSVWWRASSPNFASVLCRSCVRTRTSSATSRSIRYASTLGSEPAAMVAEGVRFCPVPLIREFGWGWGHAGKHQIRPHGLFAVGSTAIVQRGCGMVEHVWSAPADLQDSGHRAGKGTMCFQQFAWKSPCLSPLVECAMLGHGCGSGDVSVNQSYVGEYSPCPGCWPRRFLRHMRVAA